MNRFLSRVFALALVLVVGLMGCSSSPTGLSGNYRQDTLALIESLKGALELPNDSPDKIEAQVEAREKINDFSARYRRDGSLLKLSSFTTMRTALNSLAGHYSSYPNRPVPQKLKDRLEIEFNQVEAALRREG
ncbi:photosystem II protein Psb27 [Leptolyngbya sp. FACHB-711]|uniref:photosystem II protein Psb27 n=1 Tax=unclassified Leptolyngbya TaxID=2650499 RepID=UPI00168449FC|nr:photosystem II protein Psb27 [Leptolyngbya sp. FACHB-711]MBD1851952.1 photosystem II protein Psb27 [Cyanobacteria bacterium FACHB-502]MBD2027765.1 photosystem II protein Psb27 [Leptolyngbya sp. FACHB-711]